jgi:hypothetical protein
MKFTEEEVLDIIQSTTDKNPKEVLKAWVNGKADKPLDLTNYNYPHFVYTFPLILNGEEVVDITLASLHGNNSSVIDELMLKYFGREDYELSWWTFSHDTYLDCYLTIHKEFELPEIVKGFHGGTYKSKDAKGEEFEFTISYGDPVEEDDSYIYPRYANKAYRFDNGVNIIINEVKNGWSLGEKINKNIFVRTRDIKIENVLK